MRNRETKAEREKEREREREREHVTVGEVRQSIRLPGPKEFKLGFAGRVWYARLRKTHFMKSYQILSLNAKRRIKVFREIWGISKQR